MLGCLFWPQDANRLGETIYKGHRSYDLMLNLQLGIRHSVQAVAREAPAEKLAEAHFRQKVPARYCDLPTWTCTCACVQGQSCPWQCMRISGALVDSG